MLSPIVWLDMRNIRQIEYPLEREMIGLAIPQPRKDLLLSLVQNHVSDSVAKRQDAIGRSSFNKQNNLTPGRGRGLIIHLHGPSGTGKTSTVESIAAYMRRPLYSITFRDIGLALTDVEGNLEKHSHLAEKWGCILVLDEADVFLEKRSLHDLTRNMLVSGDLGLFTWRR